MSIIQKFIVVSLFLFISPLSFARGPFDFLYCVGVADFSVPGNVEKFYGPSNVNAMLGNGGLSVGVNREAVITVFKWPSPSYYDQVKYFATDRNKAYWGARGNEGVFSGIVWWQGTERHFSWLRDFDVVSQHFISNKTDTLETTFVSKDKSFEIAVLDALDPEKDIFSRTHKLIRAPDNVNKVQMVAFANFNPTVSKWSQVPIWDTCLDQLHDGDVHLSEQDHIVGFEKQGKDYSTDKNASVSISLAWKNGANTSADIGYDRLANLNFADKKDSPYGRAQSGKIETAIPSLISNAQVEASLYKSLDLSQGENSATLIIAAAPEQKESDALIKEFRAGALDIAQRKADFLENWLANARLPKTDSQALIKHSYRTLISLYQAVDKKTGAIVASISSQPPYSFDWVRDGAYFNEVLYAAGHPELVKKHNLFYAKTLVTADRDLEGDLLTKPGNWPMNMYADGVVGGPIPWEIDETGFGVWTMVRYYDVSQDKQYLETVWPSVKAAADFLDSWKQENGLPKPAHEDDIVQKPNPPTLVSSAPVLLAMKAAVHAADVLGRREEKIRWQQRVEELTKAIEKEYALPGHPLVFANNGGADYLIWPLHFHDYNNERIQATADLRYQSTLNAFLPKDDPDAKLAGQYEQKALLSVAKVWRETHPEKLELLHAPLDWFAEVNVKPGTGISGEAWFVKDGVVYPAMAPPHVWGMSLVYLTALEVYQ